MSRRSEQRQQRGLRRASRQAEGRLVSTINLIGLGIGVAVLVVILGSKTDVPDWLIGVAAIVAAVPAAVGLWQLPRAFRAHRDAKQRLT